MRTVWIVCLFFITTTVWSAEQCGVKSEDNPWILNKPCSLIANATFRKLLVSGTIKEAIKNILNAYSQYQDIVNSDCLGIDVLLERSNQDYIQLQSSRQRIRYEVETDDRGLNNLINDTIEEFYGSGQQGD